MACTHIACMVFFHIEFNVHLSSYLSVREWLPAQKQKLTKKQPIAIPDDEEDGISPPQKKKRKSVLKSIMLEQEGLPGEQTDLLTEEAARLQKLRAQAMQAFEDNDDDDDDDEEIEDLDTAFNSEEGEENARAGHVQVRAPGMQLIQIHASPWNCCR